MFDSGSVSASSFLECTSYHMSSDIQSKAMFQESASSKCSILGI